jgi:hypothetical protein
MSLLACYGISKLDKRNRDIISWGIFFLVLFQLFWVTLQYFNLDPIFKSIKRFGINETVGFSGAKDQIGAFFAITLPIVIKCCPILIPISLFGIFISHSSFAFISAIISGLLYLYFTNKKHFKTSLIAVLIVSGLFFTFGEKLTRADFTNRICVWKHSIKSTISGKLYIEDRDKKLEIHTNPVFGYGLGSFLRLFPYVPNSRDNQFNYVDEKFTHAHNDYVELFFEFGYLGLILLFAFAFSFMRSFWKAIKSKEIVLYFSCLIAYFINASGNFLSHLGMSGLLLIVLYGLYRGSLNER